MGVGTEVLVVDWPSVEPDGWITTFESFAGFLTDWGEVVTEAERRGWGVVGLRC
ncbi:hypothetical protein OEIGOIKO_06637 [Streptomyces chrestomyceticus JCM 4735]|uniref:Uncharacterized protein n=1 Tax=Streptomyces chrestomyceticus JCM 4735 TaxID=1306181 RepID=A0A7U9L1U0_9ACTN|nr:hypothetical protein [Streptomyces chrestomyceticus]GCD38818.1 hypothetical protein OEIGOIKO_06637 [Streptomyces chrestomyceticus JCM 4735]